MIRDDLLIRRIVAILLTGFKIRRLSMKSCQEFMRVGSRHADKRAWLLPGFAGEMRERGYLG